MEHPLNSISLKGNTTSSITLIDSPVVLLSSHLDLLLPAADPSAIVVLKCGGVGFQTVFSYKGNFSNYSSKDGILPCSNLSLVFDLSGGNGEAVYYEVTYVTSTSTSLIGSASSSPLYTQDSGNLSLGLALIITIISLAFVGFLFNNMTKKKPWS